MKYYENCIKLNYTFSTLSRKIYWSYETVKFSVFKLPKVMSRCLALKWHERKWLNIILSKIFSLRGFSVPEPWTCENRRCPPNTFPSASFVGKIIYYIATLLLILSIQGKEEAKLILHSARRRYLTLFKQGPMFSFPYIKCTFVICAILTHCMKCGH